MAETGLKKWFGTNLAILLSEKILEVDPSFNAPSYKSVIQKTYQNKELTDRVQLHAEQLFKHFDNSYEQAIKILVKILGPENPNETGMFTEFYWTMPIAKVVELFGQEHFDLSMDAIEAITKRGTSEFAIRPFIEKYPKEVLEKAKSWAQSENFHLRRLASEGLRPRLPWAKKLTLFLENPKPVFKILTILKSDPVRFVQKSVANTTNDYLKENQDAALELLESWASEEVVEKETKWIIKHALRKHKDSEDLRIKKLFTIANKK